MRYSISNAIPHNPKSKKHPYENLVNLGLCGTEPFWFACLPLKLENSDGAPARAIAWFED